MRKKSTVSSRIEMNGMWYLSAETAAALLHVSVEEMGSREDFKARGQFINFDSDPYYSESLCRKLANPITAS